MSPQPQSPPPATERSVGVEEARAAMRDAVGAPQPAGALAVETVELGHALCRVLAVDVRAPADLPAADTAAMDGFAFDGRILHGAHGSTNLRLRGSVLAGPYSADAPGPGGCVRIMTGAMLPPGCDTVVPLELCEPVDDQVRFAAESVPAGAHVRQRGSDMAAGQAALVAGRVLSAADLGLLASLGVARAPVRRKLKVALFSTGDELVPVGQPLLPGQVHDSNRLALAGALQRMGFEVLDQGSVRDDPQALEAALRHAATVADAVVTSGGVSAGDADHTRAVLARLGRVELWKVAMRPGRPFAFGPLDTGGHHAWLFALPGNPVAALVSLWMLAREPLLLLAGARPSPLPLLNLPASAPIAKRPGRTEFARGVVEPAPSGGWWVRPCADQGSSALRGLSQANALIVLDEGRGPVAAGEAVPVCLFEGLL